MRVHPEDSPHRLSRIKPGGELTKPPRNWWSIDPGQVHVGLAFWSEYTLIGSEETSPLGLQDYLIDSPPLLAVIESFTLLSPKWSTAKAKQAVETLKLIGAVHGIARINGTRVVEQQPSVRHVAQASPWWKELVAHNDVPANGHIRSAIAHGLYYCRFAKR